MSWGGNKAPARRSFSVATEPWGVESGNEAGLSNFIEGGQAVNLWAEWFQDTVPELSRLQQSLAGPSNRSGLAWRAPTA